MGSGELNTSVDVIIGHLVEMGTISSVSQVPTLNVKVSLKTGQRFLRWTLVSNFFFLSGNI